MEEQTNKSNTNYTPLVIIAILIVVAFLGVGALRPKQQAVKNETGSISQMETTTPTPTLTVSSTVTPSTINGIAMEEIAKHASSDSCWMVIEGKVYDVTKIIATHPGGQKAILNWCGKDGTSAFNNRGGNGPHPQKAVKALEGLLLGLFEVKP